MTDLEKAREIAAKQIGWETYEDAAAHNHHTEAAQILWHVTYEGIVRDSFWSPVLDRDDAKKEYCNQRPWIAADRVSLL